MTPFTTLMSEEKKRERFTDVLSNRVSNAGRIKTLADELLRKKFGSSGSHNRLFKRCRCCVSKSARSRRGTPEPRLLTPRFDSENFLNFDPGFIPG